MEGGQETENRGPTDPKYKLKRISPFRRLYSSSCGELQPSPADSLALLANFFRDFSFFDMIIVVSISSSDFVTGEEWRGDRKILT